MPIIAETHVLLTPCQLANEFWEMDSDDQAEFFEHLLAIAGEHALMIQALGIRDSCEKREDNDAIDAYRIMFSAAYKYLGE